VPGPVQLFIGTWPSKSAHAAIASYPRPGVDELRWATPSQWFVKMRPLGHVRDEVASELIEVLDAELDGAPTATASLEPVANRGWLVAPVSGLERLTETIFEVTERLVPVTHPQPLHAEIVLARGPRIPRDLIRPLSAKWKVTSLVLARGTRGREGPGYEDVASFALG
jgi:2'-5' RNA ligase